MSEKYTLEEVSKHNNGKSCWIVVNNKVLDVTAWLADHPGGAEVLLEQAGRIASKAFKDIGHSADAKKLTKKYEVGELVDADREKGEGFCSCISKEKAVVVLACVVPAVAIIGAAVAYRVWSQSK